MGVVRETAGALLHILSGIYELMAKGKDFRDLEEGVGRLAQEAARRMMTAVLEEIDKELCESRKRDELRLVHSKSRSLVTPFGVLEFNRRYYRDIKTGKGRFSSGRGTGFGKRAAGVAAGGESIDAGGGGHALSSGSWVTGGIDGRGGSHKPDVCVGGGAKGREAR